MYDRDVTQLKAEDYVYEQAGFVLTYGTEGEDRVYGIDGLRDLLASLAEDLVDTCEQTILEGYHFGDDLDAAVGVAHIDTSDEAREHLVGEVTNDLYTDCVFGLARSIREGDDTPIAHVKVAPDFAIEARETYTFTIRFKTKDVA